MPTTNVPRDLAEEAQRVEDPKAVELARRVAAMDPPTRAAAAVNLAVDGAPYSEIARILDYETPLAAKKAVWAAIGTVELDPEEIKHKRVIMDRTLGKLLTSVMKRGTNPHDPDHLAYARVALAIVDRQSKLWGLDAPTSVVLRTPTQREIEQYVDHVRDLRLVAAGDLEANILEVEEVADARDAS